MKRKTMIPAALLAGIMILSGCESIDAQTTMPPEKDDTAPAETVRIELEEPDDYIGLVGMIEADKGMTPEAPPAREPDPEAFHARLEEIFRDNYVCGMGVALFKDGKVVYTDSLGYADRTARREVDVNTKFRVASVSKLVTTIAVMSLVDKGLYDFDGDLSAQTGIPYEGPFSGTVKLWHLLTHTAGITDTYKFETLSISGKYPLNELIAGARTGMEAGTFYNYSNFGAGTMGAIVERLTGEFFHDYADETIFDPLGMDAGYVIDKIEDKQSCAVIYDHDGEVFNVPTWGRNAAYFESFGLGNSYLEAQCELIISPSDLALIGSALAGDGTVNGYRLLSEESIARMHTDWFDTENFGMGLNVRIYDGTLVEGRVMYGHNGTALGTVNGLYYDRVSHTGVVVLTNQCSLGVRPNSVYTMLDSSVKAAYELMF